MTQNDHTKPLSQRKRLFVDNQVQGSLVRQLVIHWCLACFLIFFYLFALQAFSNGFSLSFSENVTALVGQYGLMGLVLLVVSPVFIYDSVKLSNRFVGPMVSFRAALKKLANGENLDEVSFRQNDFWRDLTKDFNAIASELRERRGNDQESAKDDQAATADSV